MSVRHIVVVILNGRVLCWHRY